jgi:hypothetical protein
MYLLIKKVLDNHLISTELHILVYFFHLIYISLQRKSSYYISSDLITEKMKDTKDISLFSTNNITLTFPIS